MPEIRRQLSLYVPGTSATELEAVRRIVDPVQSGLIPAHVTLCREDEIDALSSAELSRRLAGAERITLRFGEPEVFSSHGILLPCIGGTAEFQALRECILGSPAIRRQEAHITLAHPRNPKAPGNSLSAASRVAGLSIPFDTVRLIEQEGRDAWRVLEAFELR